MTFARNGKNQYIGAYGFDPETGIYSLTKRVNTAKHQLRVPPAWGFDVTAIERLEAESYEYDEDNPQLILYIETEAGYERKQMTLDHFNAYRFRVDRGHGPQWAVVLEWWEGDSSVQGKLL